MSQIATARVFRSSPSGKMSRLALALGLGGFVSLAAAVAIQERPELRTILFFEGITSLGLAIRFWIRPAGQPEYTLTLETGGITVVDRNNATHLPWPEVTSIRCQMSSAGPCWQFVAATRPAPVEFPIGGMPDLERRELEEALNALPVSHIQIVPFCEPERFGTAA